MTKQNTHAVFSIAKLTEFHFATPPTEALANTLSQWFFAAVIGGLIYGTTRAGKSYAVEYVIQQREKIFGYDIPIISLQWKEERINEKDFHELFLNACGHSVPGGRGVKSSRLERRLVEYIATAVTRSGGTSVIVIIDEAQEMRLNELGYLSNIYNQLKKKKIQQFTFLVGERTLLQLRSASKAEGCERYIGRFMCADFEFPLISKTAELAFILSQYDKYSYDEGSDTTIIQSLLPKAYQSGWRFIKQAGQILQGYKTAMRAIGKKPKGMTMQTCTILVAQLLQILSQRDGPRLQLTDKDVKTAAELVKHLHNV